MRAATIADGELSVEEHADPEPGTARSSCGCGRPGLNGADMLQRGASTRRRRAPRRTSRASSWPARSPVWAPAPTRFSEGDRVMAVVGGRRPGRARRSCTSAQAMPVPDALDWPAAGGFPEVFTTAHDALFTQAGLAPASGCWCTAPRAASAPRPSSSAARRARTSPPPCATSQARGGRGARRRRRSTPRGSRTPARSTSILELVGAPNLGDNLKALATGGRIVVIGIGAGAKGELNLGAADGQARADHGARRCARGRSRRRR